MIKNDYELEHDIVHIAESISSLKNIIKNKPVSFDASAVGTLTLAYIELNSIIKDLNSKLPHE